MLRFQSPWKSRCSLGEDHKILTYPPWSNVMHNFAINQPPSYSATQSRFMKIFRLRKLYPTCELGRDGYYLISVWNTSLPLSEHPCCAATWFQKPLSKLYEERDSKFSAKYLKKWALLDRGDRILTNHSFVRTAASPRRTLPCALFPQTVEVVRGGDSARSQAFPYAVSTPVMAAWRFQGHVYQFSPGHGCDKELVATARRPVHSEAWSRAAMGFSAGPATH